MTRIDLDAAERVIHRPHVIELREDGWTVMHPPACHPDLFACPVNRAATRDLNSAPTPSELGEFFCDLRSGGRLRIGERAPDSEGIDWSALVAELRAAREVVEIARNGQLTGPSLPYLNDALIAYNRAARP
jgi:hypothetical protein